MTARKPRFDVRDASPVIFVVLGILIVVNAMVTVLVVRPKVVRHRQLTDLSSPQFQVVNREQRFRINARFRRRRNGSGSGHDKLGKRACGLCVLSFFANRAWLREVWRRRPQR